MLLIRLQTAKIEKMRDKHWEFSRNEEIHESIDSRTTWFPRIINKKKSTTKYITVKL